MKRLFMLSFSILLAVAMSVSSFALDIYDEYFRVKDGNSYLGTFATLPLSDLQKDNLRSFLDNELNFILLNNARTKYYLLSLGDEAGFDIDYVYDECCSITFNCNVSGTVWSCAGDGILVYDSVFTCSSGDELDGFIIVGGRAFSTCDITFPSPIANYVADYKGNLMLVDDGGLMADPVESDSDSENSGILGFLSDFWETFKKFLIGLFVPSDGYFSEWYEEIKSALDNKLGAITALYKNLTGFFSGIKIANHTIMVEHIVEGREDFAFFSGDVAGWLSTFRSLLTGVMVLSCWIHCYHKIIELVHD